MSAATDIRAVLAERGATHGDYGEHAQITQAIKATMASTAGWYRLDPHERETLHMLAHKVGRILAGNPHFEDHWRDIAGYATLSADRNRPELMQNLHKFATAPETPVQADRHVSATGVAPASSDRPVASAERGGAPVWIEGEHSADLRWRDKLVAPGGEVLAELRVARDGAISASRRVGGVGWHHRTDFISRSEARTWCADRLCSRPNNDHEDDGA